MHCRYLLIVIGGFRRCSRNQRGLKPATTSTRYVTIRLIGSLQSVKPVASEKETDLNGIGRSRREAGDRHGWTRLRDELRDRRPRRVVDVGRATNFVHLRAVNCYKRHLKLAAVPAGGDVANELRQRLLGGLDSGLWLETAFQERCDVVLAGFFGVVGKLTHHLDHDS